MMNNKIYVLVLVLFQLAANCFAQQLQRYQGNYLLENGLLCHESYQYYLDRKDTVRHGNFKLEYAQKSELGDTSPYSATSIAGKYTRGLKSNHWIFSQKKLSPKAQGTIQEYVIMYPTSGEEQLINAYYTKGKAQGRWSSYRWRIDNSLPVDTIYRSEANFQNSIMIGSFNAYSEDFSVIGQLNRKGEVDGKSIFLHTAGKRFEEHRNYKDGILLSHLLIQGTDTLELYKQASDTYASEKQMEVVELDEKYFKIQQSNNHNFLADSLRAITKASDQFWLQSLCAYTGQDHGTWTATPGAERIRIASAKIQKLPFTTKELAQKEELQKIIIETKNKLNTLLHDPQVAVAQYSNLQMGLYYNVLKQFKKSVLLTDSVLTFFDLPEFEYTDRPQAFAAAFASFSYQPNMYIKINEQIVHQTYQFIQVNTQTPAYLPALITHLQWINENVNNIKNHIDHSLEQIRLQNILVKQEAVMMKKLDRVKALFANNLREQLPSYHKNSSAEDAYSYNEFHQMVSSKVFEFVDAEINQYANQENDEKIARGKELLICFQDLENLYNELAQIPIYQANINKAYTQTVFNPYTYTYLDERMKVRMYTAYESKIFPFLVLQLQESLSCGSIVPKANNFKILYQAMLDFLKHDTHRLERRISKNDSPEKLIKKFDLNLYY